MYVIAEFLSTRLIIVQRSQFAFVCIYVCMYMYVHVCIYVHVCTCMYIHHFLISVARD